MPEQIHIVIVGAGGRMGQQLILSALQMNNISLSATIESEDYALLGIDAGELVGVGKVGVNIQSSLNLLKNNFDVLIDFTCPKGTMDNLMFCHKHNKAMVIGTTGLSNPEKQIIKEISNEIPIVFSTNFSIGINVILKLLGKVTKAMGNHVDIGIIEAHHRGKSDTPSGTALAIGKEIANAMNENNDKYTGNKIPSNIDFATIRAGDIIGEHTVIFANTGERIEISHRAYSRIPFATGALKAAIWLKGKQKGLFNMIDVLNINEYMK